MDSRQRVIKVFLVSVAMVGDIISIGYSPKKDAMSASVSRLNFAPTAARLERGRYIVEGPAHCFQCHSEVNWERPGAQPKPEKKGAGTVFIEDGMDWLVAPNITPDVETGAGSW